MRAKILSALPFVAALCAMVIVVIQQVEIGKRTTRLERRLKTMKLHLDKSLGALRAELGSEENPSSRSRLRDFDSRLSRLEKNAAMGGKRLALPAAVRLKEEPRKAGAGLRAELDRLKDTVDALLREEALNTQAGKQRLQEIVSKAYDTARKTRRKRWRKIRQEATRDRLAQFADKANLSDRQLKDLRNLIDGEREKRRQIFSGVRQQKKPLLQARKEFRDLRKETTQKARDLLDEEQFDLYKKEFRRGGRRGPGRW